MARVMLTFYIHVCKMHGMVKREKLLYIHESLVNIVTIYHRCYELCVCDTQLSHHRPVDTTFVTRGRRFA